MTIQEWTKDNAGTFSDAIAYMTEDIDDGDSFEFALEHHAELFGIDREALRYEWNLVKEDCR